MWNVQGFSLSLVLEWNIAKHENRQSPRTRHARHSQEISYVQISNVSFVGGNQDTDTSAIMRSIKSSREDDKHVLVKSLIVDRLTQ